MARKWWTLACACSAVFMLLVDVTIVNVALPDISSALGADFTELQWVVDAYALTLAAFLLTGGSLADLLGRRRVFAVGLGVFTIASLVCGLATTPVFLILARGVQGIGGALMFSTALALIASEFSGRERGVAFGAWGATAGVAVAIGPLIGGALTTGLGWEWIFFVNVPVGIAAIAVALLKLAESRDPDARGVDWGGLVTFSLGLFLLVFALLRAHDEGWGSPLIVGSLTTAALLLALFLVIELRQERPMLDLSLYRKPAFVGANIASFGVSASVLALFLYVALYMQRDLGYSAFETGLRFLPISLCSFLAAGPAGRLSALMPVRLLIGTGLAMVGIGLLLMRAVSPGSDWDVLVPGMVVAGIGIGLTNPPTASTAIAVVQPARAGMASGINTTFRQVGIATGIAGLGAIFTSRVDSELEHSLAGTPLAAGSGDFVERLSASGSQLGSLPPGQRETVSDAIDAAFVRGLDEVFLVGAIVALMASAAAFALIRQRDFVVAPAEGAPEG